MTGQALSETIRRLRALGSDDAYAEVKASVGRLPKDTWSSVSALANTKGGQVILGIDERSGFRPAEGFDPNPILDALSDGLNPQPGKRPKVTPLPPTSIEQLEFEGAVVIVLTVEPLAATPAPCYVTDQGLENGAYRRWDDQDIHLTSYQIHLLRHRHELTPTDRDVIAEVSLADLDTQVIDRIVSRLRSQGSRVLLGAEDLTTQLQRLNIVTPAGGVTLAGLLSLGAYPQQFLPQLFVDVAVHPGLVKSDPRTDIRFLDHKICEGPIPAMVEQAVGAVMRNLRTARVVEGTRGRDVPEIPEDVIREAVVNALTHRDYSVWSRGQQVGVDVYPDRVEITSPGGLWGGITPENIGEGVSRSRNDTLAKLLTRVPLGSEGMVCENQGSGVPRMIGAMRARGLPLPEFDDRLDGVRVILHRFGLLAPETRAWLDDLTAHQLTAHQEMALVLAKAIGEVTPQELRQQLGIDTDDARADLARLQQLDLLDHVAPDTFMLGTGRPIRDLTSAEMDVWNALDPHEPMTVQELSRATGRTVGGLRPVLRRMVERGDATPTAPPTSRNRAYVRGPVTRHVLGPERGQPSLPLTDPK